LKESGSFFAADHLMFLLLWK